jgi:hypothetical protein
MSKIALFFISMITEINMSAQEIEKGRVHKNLRISFLCIYDLHPIPPKILTYEAENVPIFVLSTYVVAIYSSSANSSFT